MMCPARSPRPALRIRVIPTLRTRIFCFVAAASPSYSPLAARRAPKDAQATGLLLAFLGLLMSPANMIVSHRFEDREPGDHIILYSSLVAILCDEGRRRWSSREGEKEMV